MRTGIGLTLSLLATACFSSIEPAPTYEPLVCVPAAADHVAFAVQESSWHFGPEATKAYGEHFLLIDGSCRYYTASGRGATVGEVRTGTLTATQLDAINAELLAGPWETIDGEHRYDIMGADASTFSIWRDDFGASCYDSCRAGSEALRTMLDTAIGWEERLGETSAPLDGDVRLSLQRFSAPIDGAVEWTGATSLAEAMPFSGYGGTLVVSDPSDTAALRALRATLAGWDSWFVLSEGDAYFRVVVVDVMPHVNEDGRLLPPFPIHT